MSNSVSLSGNDTIIINDRSLTDLADQDTATLTFTDDLVTVAKGKNGNAIYTLNSSGDMAEVAIRVIKGSEDDKYLQNILTIMRQNLAGFVLMTGEFIKKIGDGKGNITRDTYLLSGGVIKKNVDAKESVAGDTESGVSIYMLQFSKAPRTLG